MGTTLADLAGLAGRRNAWEESTRLAREALDIFAALGHQRGIARIFEFLALSAKALGDARTSIVLFASAHELRRELGVPSKANDKSVIDQAIEGVERELGSETARAAWTEGATMPIERAVDLAMGA